MFLFFIGVILQSLIIYNDSRVLLFNTISTIKPTSDNNLNIEIDTKKNEYKINGIQINSFHLSEIEKVLGKPDRIKEDVFQSYLEEFPYESGGQRTIKPIQVKNYYYIYDKIGIVLFTHNGEYANKKPSRMHIYFSHQREFSNHIKPHFIPRIVYNGIVIINSEVLNKKSKLVPAHINYKNEYFNLFGIKVGPTSIGTIIDSLYSIDSRPYLRLYLNNGKDQKISFLEIVVKSDD